MTHTPFENAAALTPPAYLIAIRDYLRTHEPDLWRWFTSQESRTEYDKAMRLDLLKATYRLDAEAHPNVHREAREAAERLGLEDPITLYQSQEASDLNAMLYHIPGEAHVVLTGPVLRTLDDAELRCLFGHELSHALLWGHDDGSLQVTDRILAAMAHDSNSEPSHVETHLRFRRYVEIYCDRGSYVASQNVDATVSTLIKMKTGLSEVSPAAYIKQADEIFKDGGVQPEGFTHPENYIRARALHLFALEEPDTEAQVARMVEGAPHLETLDILSQARCSVWTQGLFDHLFEPGWMRTSSMLATASLFFEGYQPQKPDPALFDQLVFEDDKLRDYYLYVLLDFLIADPELEDTPLALFVTLSERFGATDRLCELVHKELKVQKRVISRIRKEASAMLEQAATR